MKCLYISVEKGLNAFEFYKGLWKKHRVDGIRVDSVTEGMIVQPVMLLINNTYGVFEWRKLLKLQELD